jgi:hypothetical protein
VPSPVPRHADPGRPRRSSTRFAVAVWLSAIVVGGSAVPVDAATPETPSDRGAERAVDASAPNPDCEVAPANAVRQADKLMADRYDLGTLETVTIPFPPTWSEDPHNDRNWRFRLHSLDWLLALIAATSATGERRYLDRALDLARSWLEANTREEPASDFSWNDHSTALRAQVLVCLAKAAPGLDWLEDGLELHGTTLADPTFYVNRGNHALNQDIGLLEVGCFLGRGAWTQLARERIDTLLAQSVDRQGVVNEQAIGYALYNYQRYTVAGEVLDACGQPEPAGFERVRKIPVFLAHATEPDGRYPLIGDTLDVAATVIPGTVAAFAATQGARGPKPETDIRVFDAGYIFGRTGWGESRRVGAETYFTLRFGQGREHHGHDDQGSLTLYGEGARLLADAGLYAYEFDRRRDFVLSRDAHNAVVVAGKRSDPSKPARLVRSRRDRRSFDAVIDVRAYEPITHRRRVVFSRQLGYLIVEDRLDAPGTTRERFTQLWHLRQGSSPMVTGRTVRTRRPHGNVVIRQLLGVGSTRIVSGRDNPLQGWLSLRYRELRAAPVVEARIDGGSARFLTLIVPVMRSKSRVRVDDVKVTSEGVTMKVTVGRESERITMTSDRVRIESAH